MRAYPPEIKKNAKQGRYLDALIATTGTIRSQMLKAFNI